ncbi:MULTISPECIES: MerR family transcriptional regulator [Mycolicibacterium]|uniref:MerR family transcriptional regulator n=1 Tax=Mycobacterium bourgelatii TaxID=1273442 RepID=A0A7I9YLD8_MYCBU|nr:MULTISPECIES: MerR family transcriptional regulator [Mycolicibacterium]UCZ59004.1 MerR family transcriptional regulator [Mycolicibacterium phocaicum]GFG89437.1 MerR family transcriptional regulator [Mycobacterium bourgelatii]
MRLSELSRAAGLSPTTVKWYLRIGLLHRGQPTAVNQARYDDSHLRRLRLIRALIEVGGLSTDEVGDLIAAIDDPHRSIQNILAHAHRASAASAGTKAAASAAPIDDYIRHRGWRVRADSPARRDLAAVLDAIAALRPQPASGAAGVSAEVTTPDTTTPDAVYSLLDPYADAVEPLAAAEIANTPADLPRDLLVERVVAGTILLERAIAALRRLAQEHHATKRYGDPKAPADTP